MPANDTYQPASTTLAASRWSPAKQWNTTRGGAPSPSRMASTSAMASRQCTTRVLSSSRASWTWAAKAVRWVWRGELS
jgi:hypothetical protein